VKAIATTIATACRGLSVSAEKASVKLFQVVSEEKKTIL
jgi:hypothetical protein